VAFLLCFLDFVLFNFFIFFIVNFCVLFMLLCQLRVKLETSSDCLFGSFICACEVVLCAKTAPGFWCMLYPVKGDSIVC
jgi:hypothetical protein